MKITLAVSDLKAALKPITDTVGKNNKNNSIPILGNLWMRAYDHTSAIILRGSDLDSEVQTTISSGAVAESGACTLPAHLLWAIVGKLNADADVTLELDHENKLDPESTKIAIRSGRSRFKLPTLPPEDFPSLAVDAPTQQFALTATHVKALFDNTAFAISTDESRYYLNGVHLHDTANGEAHGLRAVATDGHRLAQIDCDGFDRLDAIIGPDGKRGLIVPRNTVEHLLKAVDKNTASVTVLLCPGRIVFDLGNIRLTSKLVDGTFPDYERVIPQGNTKLVTADREALSEAVGRVALISDGSTSRSLKLSVNSGALELSMIDGNGGTATEDMDAEYDGEPLAIGFNSTYLKDILGHIATEKVQFRLNGAGDPALIQGISPDGVAGLFVLMPMRI